MKKSSNIIWGIIFVIVGIIWGLNAMGLIDVTILFKGWWTLFLIIPGITSIIEKPKEIFGYCLMIIGVILLLCVRDVISFSLISKLIIPAILIIIGISIIFKGKNKEEISNEISDIDKSEMDIYTASFTQNKVTLREKEFKNAKLDVAFGSIILDLTECDIDCDKVITTSCIFGSIEIYVPKNINVKVKSTNIFAATDNLVKNTADDNTKTIYVDSFSMFGGVDIK